MELSIVAFFMAFGAGIVSIASPCVLPVVPLLVTGQESDSRWRPVSIVAGLAFSFVIMGVISSLAGSLIAGKMILLEKITGVVILIFGVLMLFDINLFKKVTFFNRFSGSQQNRGVVAGFILGASLGLVWIPCVGPMLSSVLATVATAGKAIYGVTLLLTYSAGFAVPMLLAAYFSQQFRRHVGILYEKPLLMRVVNGGVLAGFGIYILSKGMM